MSFDRLLQEPPEPAASEPEDPGVADGSSCRRGPFPGPAAAPAGLTPPSGPGARRGLGHGTSPLPRPPALSPGAQPPSGERGDNARGLRLAPGGGGGNPPAPHSPASSRRSGRSSAPPLAPPLVNHPSRPISSRAGRAESERREGGG